MDWGGGKDDEDRGFRQYSGPFSFDTPLFDITTPLDLADAYGDGDDNSEEASPPPFPSYARQPKPTFRRGREDAMNVDTAPRFSSGYSTAFVPDQGFPTFTGGATDVLQGGFRHQPNQVQIKQEPMDSFAPPANKIRRIGEQQFGENTFGQPPAPFGYSPPEAHPMHSAGLGMTGTIPSIDSLTHHQMPQFPVINRGPVLDGEAQDQVEDGDTDDMKAEDTYSNSHNAPVLVVESQPPIEVRTRTPSEKRNFSCSVMVLGPWKEAGGKFVMVELLYAPHCADSDEMPKQNILGGTKSVTIKGNGSAVFDNLSMSEASTKHKEKEFILRFTLLDKNGQKMPFHTATTSFYAFSNTKVLSRRREIQLRTLSKNFGPFQGGEMMHVIGSPFIKGPGLKLVFRTPHGDVPASGLELYSETVLFFTLPSYPHSFPTNQPEPQEIKVKVMVTNDGRNYSNALDFTYVPGRKAMRSYL